MREIMAPDSYSHTILIADDTPANLGVVVESLEERGFRVVVAEDREEGLDARSSSGPT